MHNVALASTFWLEYNYSCWSDGAVHPRIPQPYSIIHQTECFFCAGKVVQAFSIRKPDTFVWKTDITTRAARREEGLSKGFWIVVLCVVHLAVVRLATEPICQYNRLNDSWTVSLFWDVTQWKIAIASYKFWTSSVRNKNKIISTYPISQKNQNVLWN
jgi:hypothetical protein